MLQRSFSSQWVALGFCIPPSFYGIYNSYIIFWKRICSLTSFCIFTCVKCPVPLAKPAFLYWYFFSSLYHMLTASLAISPNLSTAEKISSVFYPYYESLDDLYNCCNQAQYQIFFAAPWFYQYQNLLIVLFEPETDNVVLDRLSW